MQKNWNLKLKFPDEYGTQLPLFLWIKKKNRQQCAAKRSRRLPVNRKHSSRRNVNEGRIRRAFSLFTGQYTSDSRACRRSRKYSVIIKTITYQAPQCHITCRQISLTEWISRRRMYFMTQEQMPTKRFQMTNFKLECKSGKSAVSCWYAKWRCVPLIDSPRTQMDFIILLRQWIFSSLSNH